MDGGGVAATSTTAAAAGTGTAASWGSASFDLFDQEAQKVPKQHGGSSSSGGTPKNISLAQLRPFLEIAIPFFREDRAAFYALIGIIVLTFVKSLLRISFSYVRRDIFDALNHRDQGKFWRMVGLYFVVLVLVVPIVVLYHYLRAKLALYWRKELTKRVLDKYYANRTYYIIECCRDIDNPDQRISEDLREFTSTSLDFFFIVFDAVINLFSFSAVLFQIYPMLFVAIIAYSFIGTYFTAILGQTLVGQYYNRLLREADFRFGLIRTRENAEGIAFYDSEAKLEKVNLWTLFEMVLDSHLKVIYTRRRLESFTVTYDYLVYVIPYLVLAPRYLAGKVNLGSITQGSEAFNHVRGDFSIVMDYFEKLSAFSAGIDRLSTFIRRINEGGWSGSDPHRDGGSALDGSSGHGGGGMGGKGMSMAAGLTCQQRVYWCCDYLRGGMFCSRFGLRSILPLGWVGEYAKVRQEDDSYGFESDELEGGSGGSGISGAAGGGMTDRDGDIEMDTHGGEAARADGWGWRALTGQGRRRKSAAPAGRSGSGKRSFQTDEEPLLSHTQHTPLTLLAHVPLSARAHGSGRAMAFEPTTITMISIPPTPASTPTAAVGAMAAVTATSFGGSPPLQPSTTPRRAPMLQCLDLTVFTPDGHRPLLGAIEEGGRVGVGVGASLGAGTGLGTGGVGAGGSALALALGADQEPTAVTLALALSTAPGSLRPSLSSELFEASASATDIHPPPHIHSQRRGMLGVNFEVWEGDRVLVVGPSGTGKSSLLRAISGLWELGSGRIVWNTGKGRPTDDNHHHHNFSNSSSISSTSCNSNSNSNSNSTSSSSRGNSPNCPEGVFFLPQKPYNLLGSLRQQIAYPSILPGEFGDDDAGDGDGEGEGDEGASGRGLGLGPASRLGLVNRKNKNGGGGSGSGSGSGSGREGGSGSGVDGGTGSDIVDMEGSEHSDAELLNILRRVRLDTLAARMGSGDERVGLRVYKDWSKVLSLGEQQRLAFARLLYNSRLGRISVAVLDEATSALDEVSEAAMYGLLDEIRLTYMSVGHRSSLYKFHTKKLVLKGPGMDVECVSI